MANSGRRGNDDPERACCVRSDAARKRAALRFTRWARSPPPPSLLRRETEEYDRAHGRLFSGTGSSSGASSSRSSLTPVKRELPPVKMEPEAVAGPKRRAGGVIGPEDFLPPAEAEALLPTLLARSARDAEEDRQRRRRDEAIDTVLYEQGVASAHTFDDKLEEWRREAAEQDRIYIDLTSSDNDN